MASPHNYSMLSNRDPVWIGLGLGLLLFLALIVAEISLVPTYIDVKIEVDGYSSEWFEPERTTIQLQTSDGWPARYYLSQRMAEICPLDSGSGLEFETALQDWAGDSNWEIVNPSMAFSCLEYAGLGLDVGEDPSGVITLKPLGWDEGMQWNATLCLTVFRDEPCSRITILSIVPSLGVMVADQ